jgi:tetratricopeptide (TPR) repeat protein
VTSAWFNCGVAWMDLGRPEPAVACFEKVAAQQPDDPDAHLNLGIALRAAGRLDDARRAMETARAKAPHDVMILNELIAVLRELASKGPNAAVHHDRAVALARQSLELDGEQPDLRRFVGDTVAPVSNR